MSGLVITAGKSNKGDGGTGGDVTISSGDSTKTSTGNIVIKTPDAATVVAPAPAVPGGATGSVTLSSGDATNGGSGDISISSGKGINNSVYEML